MRIHILFIVCLFFSPLLVKPVLAQTPTQTAEMACTQETLSECYKKGVQLFQDKDYEHAKTLFEQVVALKPTYKRAKSYLKKCYDQLAKLEAEEKSIGVNPNIAEAPQDALIPPYRLGLGDVLEVSVWRVPDLDRSVIIGPDGTISLPLAGRIGAAGLTLTELDEQLTLALKEYVRVPEVSVAVQRFGGIKVIVLGEVKSPGVLALTGGATLIDVIATAGGFNNDAIKRGVILIRGGLAQPEVYRLNASRIFKGDLSQNITVASNDIIYVPRKFIVNLALAMSRMQPILTNILLGTTTYRDLKALPQ